MTEKAAPYIGGVRDVEEHIGVVATELRELQEAIVTANMACPRSVGKKRLLSLLQATKEAADKLEEALKP